MVKKLSVALYGIAGGLLILGGGIGLFYTSLAIPQQEGSSEGSIEYIALLQDVLAHYAMELGGTFLALGVVLIWCAFNYEKVGKLNYAFLIFALAFAGIHWYEYFDDARNILSPVLNTVPVLLFGALIYFRKE